ncbi:MAG: glycosyltransferase [Clostridium sp.]|nr:glycosyltransferase [Clostridium sp.]
MMRTRTVALLGDGLYTWDGGVDYLSNIAGILEYVDRNREDYRIRLYLVLPMEYPVVRLARKFLSKGERDDIARFSYIIEVFRSACQEVQVVYYRKHVKKLHDDKGKSLQKTLTKIGADICFPILRDYYPELRTPWIGYIADFQEKYLPELFDEQTRSYREKNSICQTRNTQYFIATSESVKKDLEEFYPGEYQVFAQPFAPMAADSFFDTSGVALAKYALPEVYFLISNQFWSHKDHRTAFRALKRLHEQGYGEVHIVCTGKMDDDFRNASYCDELRKSVREMGLEDSIHFLGYIPKLDQIEIMKRSVCLLQPSLFEGDPGGCSAYNAASLLIPVIMSDIRVNREAEGVDGITLFEAENPDSLAECMKNALKEKRRIVSDEQIREHNRLNADKLAAFYVDMIEEVIRDYQVRKQV